MGYPIRQRGSWRCSGYLREDVTVVTDASQRPCDGEYDRYLWLLEEMKSARYDDESLPEVMSFAVEDVFVCAIFSVACDVFARSARTTRGPRRRPGTVPGRPIP